MSPTEINDKITEKQYSIYGLNAMLQRKIEIVNILFKKIKHSTIQLLIQQKKPTISCMLL